MTVSNDEKPMLFLHSDSFGALIRKQAFHTRLSPISTLAYWSRIFQSCIFRPCIFDHPAFSGLAFSVAPCRRHSDSCRYGCIGVDATVAATPLALIYVVGVMVSPTVAHIVLLVLFTAVVGGIIDYLPMCSPR